MFPVANACHVEQPKTAAPKCRQEFSGRDGTLGGAGPRQSAIAIPLKMGLSKVMSIHKESDRVEV